MNSLRNHKSYIAALGHRLSGVALAIFLPFHFVLLASAFDGAEGLDRLLVYTELPLVKVAEWGLVVLLSLHLCFGLRVLLIEFRYWPINSDVLAKWVLPGALASGLVGIIFVIQVW